MNYIEDLDKSDEYFLVVNFVFGKRALCLALMVIPGFLP